jgi:hypothetical protein
MAWPLSCLICNHCPNSWGISRQNCENMTLTGGIWNKLCNDSEYFLYLRLKHTYVQVQEQPPILITFSAWALSEVLFTFSSLYLYQALYSENSNFWVTSGVFEVFSCSSDDHYGCKFQGCMMLKHFIGLIWLLRFLPVFLMNSGHVLSFIQVSLGLGSLFSCFIALILLDGKYQ